jgi:hypothetical protein
MKIFPVEVQLFHADRGTDRNDEANNSFLQILRKRLKPKDTSYSIFTSDPTCCGLNGHQQEKFSKNRSFQDRYMLIIKTKYKKLL